MMTPGLFLEQRLSARTLAIDAMRQWERGLSIKELAEFTQVPRASLRRIVSRLIQSGEVTATREPGFLTVYKLHT